jgi:hypothetical protein
MNEQVRRYLESARRTRWIQENTIPVKKNKPCLVIEADLDALDEMARWKDNPANFRVEPNDEDFDFIWAARRKAKSAGVPDTQLPTPGKLLQAKYTLLLLEPLHEYDPREEDGSWKIYEIGKRGTATPVATVDDVMRDAYKRANKKEVPDDKTVAMWWIADNKDAVHEGVMGGSLPSPQFKIVRRGGESVSLAFRSSKKYYGWIVVEDIPIDMPAFRKRAEEQGFNARAHAKKILESDKKAWQSIVGAKAEGDAPVEDGVGRVGRGLKPFYNLGYNALADDPSEDYADKYNDDIEFRKHVEKIVIRAATKHIGGIFIDENQVDDDFGDDEAGSPWERGEINYKVGKKPGYEKANIDFSQVNDIMNDARKRLLTMSGYAPFDWKNITKEEWEFTTPEQLVNDPRPVNDWLRRESANGVRNAKRDRFGKEHTASGDDSEDGGAGIDSLQANMLGRQMNSVGKKTFTTIRPGEDEGKPDKEDMPEEAVIAKLGELIRASKKPQDDPELLRLVFKYAKDGVLAPRFQQFIQAFGLTPPSATGDPAKYHSQLPTGVPAHAEGHRYSFTKYLEWRTGGR